MFRCRSSSRCKNAINKARRKITARSRVCWCSRSRSAPKSNAGSEINAREKHCWAAFQVREQMDPEKAKLEMKNAFLCWNSAMKNRSRSRLCWACISPPSIGHSLSPSRCSRPVLPEKAAINSDSVRDAAHESILENFSRFFFCLFMLDAL